MTEQSEVREVRPTEESPSNKNNYTYNVLVLIKWFTTNNKYTSDVKVTTLAELNQQVQGLINSKSKEDLELVTKDASILCMRPLLVDNMPKDGIVAYFRQIMVSTEVCDTYKKFNIPLLISKILEKDGKDIVKGIDNKTNRPPDAEIVECLKFIKTWVEVSPKTIPKLLVSSLMALAEMPVDEKESKRECINIDQKLLAIDTIRLLAVHNFQLWNWSGGIAVLINAISDPYLAQKSQEIVYTLLYLLNEPKIRNNTHLFEDLNKIFWIFTDIDVNPDRAAQKTKTDEFGNPTKTKFLQQLDLSKKAVITLLKSWVGLIYLGNQTKTLKSFIESLRQKLRPEIRFAIYEILESLLSIGHQSYKSKESSMSGNLKISNLLNCYLITLVQLLIDCDLFKILVELSGLEDSDVAIPAQKFLKQLTILMFNSLPNSSKYIDFLISAATQSGEYSIELKSCSSYVINKIGNYIFDDKIKQEPVILLNQLQSMYVSSNLFIPLAKASIAETTYAINLLQEEQSTRNKHSPQNLGVHRQNKHTYQKWKWEMIEETLKNAYDTKTKLDIEQNKFIPYLLKFFSPGKNDFISLEWKIENFKYLRVGQLLFKNLVTLSSYIDLLKTASKAQFEVTIPFLEEIKFILMKLLDSCLVMTPLAFIQTMQREVVCWFGLLSYTKQAYLELLVKNNIFQIIDAYIGKEECDMVIVALLFSFDYNRENVVIKSEEGKEESFGPRSLLENALFRGSDRLVLQGLQIMRILYRTEVIDFQNWGFEMLARTLLEVAPRSPEIMESMMELLTESFEDSSNLINFIKELRFQRLQQIKGKLSSKFLIKILSNETGIENIMKHMSDWLDLQFSEWMSSKNLEYNSQMESKLKDALNFVEPKIEGFTMKQPHNFIEAIYIYKLPWIAQIQSMYFPLMPLNKSYGFSLEGNINLQIPDGSLVEFLLMIGVMYVDFKLNYMGEEKPKSTRIEVDLRDKTQYISKSNGQFDIVKQRVTFSFQRVEENNSQVLYLRKIKIQLRLRKVFDDSELPIHLFGELSKTAPGVKYLREKKAHLTFLETIQNKQNNANEVRAALWALGFIGSCNHGMTLIKESKVVDILIKMCFSHNYLSLRGTCRYILNMICSVSEGRKEITEKGWLTNSNSSIGWICVPPDSKRFFTIEAIDPNFWPNNNQAWALYSSALQPLSQKQKQLIRSISLMSNTLSFKVGQEEVKRILSNSNFSASELRSSAKLFKNIILLITFYNFKLETRRSIFMMFDEYIRSAKFMNDIQNAKFYII